VSVPQLLTPLLATIPKKTKIELKQSHADPLGTNVQPSKHKNETLCFLQKNGKTSRWKIYVFAFNPKDATGMPG